jgi:arginase family enzyme
VTVKRDPLPVFAGIPSFCRLPIVDRKDLLPEMAAIAGVAFDTTCSGRIGSRFGPRAIRETSQYFAAHSTMGDTLVEVSIDEMMAFGDPPRVVDINDLNVYPADVARTTDAVSDAIAEIVGVGAMPVILGGDEYVGLPVLSGFARGWASRGAADVGYIQVSSHLGLGNTHPVFGQDWGGATARRMIESKVVAPAQMAWLGASGQCRGDEWDLVQTLGLSVTPVSAVRRMGPTGTAVAALDRVGQGTKPVLVSVDMSVVDGVYAPGTSEPSFWGLTNSELLALMDALGHYPAQGLVVTGVNPRIEATWTTERLAVLAILRFLAPRFLPSSESRVDVSWSRKRGIE